MTIQNPFPSHLTERQHSKLAAHYIRRYHMMGACNKGHEAAIDYAVMFHKYLYHNRRAMALRKIAQDARTESGLIELNTICKGA